MKALVCKTPLDFAYVEMQEPAVTKDHVVIKIKRVGVCGTDIHAYGGTQPFFTYPRILGHEVSAELVTSNGALGFEEGEQITFIPYFNCGQCSSCLAGRTNCCEQLKVCGVHVDGAMREYLSIPTHTLFHGQGLSLEKLALIEPLAIGSHAVRRANIKRGEYVLVSGLGPIGLGIVQFAALQGAKVIAVDVNDFRLQFCKGLGKAEHVLQAKESNIMDHIKDITKGAMPSAIFDATGNLNAINNAFRYMGHGARYVLVGLQLKEISFSHPEFHKREGTLMSSRNATRDDFNYVFDCVLKGDIDPEKLITNTVAFENVKNEFPKFSNPEENVIKPIIHF